RHGPGGIGRAVRWRCAALAVGARARRDRLERHDPARARRPGHGRRDPRHESRCGRDSTACLPRRHRRLAAGAGDGRRGRLRASGAPRGRARGAWSPVSADELVLVVPRPVLMADPGWHGIRSDVLTGGQLEALVAEHGEFRPRAEVEPDRTWKQVIPYLVLRDGPRYFLMRRTKAGGDARLHDLWTIGVGGHLNPGDGDLAGGLRREWREEVRASFEPEFELIGLINDDTTDVGSVHVGAVYVADARGRDVTVLETDKLRGAFADPDEVARVVDHMETWSALAFRHLEGVPA